MPSPHFGMRHFWHESSSLWTQFPGLGRPFVSLQISGAPVQFLSVPMHTEPLSHCSPAFTARLPHVAMHFDVHFGSLFFVTQVPAFSVAHVVSLPTVHGNALLPLHMPPGSHCS